RRHRGHPRPAGGRHHHRQERDEWAEWRLRHRWGRRRLRPAPQSAQPRARDRRIVVGFGRGRGRAPGRHLLRRRPGRLHPHSRRVLRIIGHKPTFGLVSHFGIGFGSDQSIDYTGPMTRTVEDAAAALQATAGYDPYDPRPTRDVPTGIDVLGRLADGVSRLRIGVLQEGFDEAEVEVRNLVLAAVDVLARAGADVSEVSIPEHHAIRTAQAALSAEGALAVFNTGFFGAFTRTYYPASLIAAINKMWASHADVLTPRTKLGLIAAEWSRRTYHGRVYAKAQNVRPTYIKAYD